jgi:uncharacterized protein YbaP (TraB family)
MIDRVFLIGAGLLVSLLLPAWSAAEEAPHPTRGPFLWEVEAPKGTSHLFGTIHVGVHLSELDPAVTERLAAATTVVGEVDPREAFSPEILTLAMLPAETSLRSMLGAEDWKRLLVIMGSQMPEAMLDRCRPWFVISLILTKDQERTPMDLDLFSRSIEGGKELAYLEEISEQTAFLDRALGIEDLVELLEDPEEALAQVQASVKSYRAGDHQAFTQLLREERSKASNRKRFEILFDQRNQAWLPEIEDHIQKGGAFIAVGAGHLLTEDGLVALLRQRGYKVTRVLSTSVPAAAPSPQR